MSLDLVVAPATEPVTLAEAKAQARVEHNAEDALFALWIQGAREAAEHELGRALITQTWELRLDGFSVAEIELLKPKALSIVSVKYDDAAGDEQTLADTVYTLDGKSMPPRLLLNADASWPATSGRPNCVRIQFTAGYGDAAADVPAAVRHWMLLQIAAAARNREAFQTGITVAELPNRYVDHLLDRERTYL